ncbi:helix-turn-helix domain-containing protein (plasmid) [Rhodococcus opacus]|nr:helix-turn-helix domain-containing protein [Rhodococcus opacus]
MERSTRRTTSGVHANTIRYRTARIEQLTGLDVATDAHAQLTAQLALLILRMNGLLPPTSALPMTDHPTETSDQIEADEADEADDADVE